jgi:F-box and WD-40 domain protein 1/11
MIPSRKPSLLVTHRPKTSSAADEKSAASGGFESLIMKRTASQTFSPTLDALADRHDANMPLGSLKEGASVEEYPASQHQHSGSLSRIPTSLKSSCKQICRRLSASSTSRRPSLASIADNWTGNSSASESSTEQLLPPRLQLHHKDSGIPTPFETITPGTLHSRFSALKRLGSVRNRRPATSGPSGDFAKFNPSPAPYLGHYSASPNPLPGSAARAAAAAANNERLNVQRQEQEQVTAFLSGGRDLGHPVDEVLQDSESGVGMEVSTPITRADGAENKLGMAVNSFYHVGTLTIPCRPNLLSPRRDQRHDLLQSRRCLP